MTFPRGTAFILTFLFFLPALPGVSPAAAPHPGAKLLQPELLERNRQEPVRVIALLRGWESLTGLSLGQNKAAEKALRQAVARLQEEVLTGLGPGLLRVTARYANLPALALEVPPGALERLARLGGVGLIEADRPLFAQGGEKTPAPGESPPLARELTGAGVALAFVDTGVDYNTVGPSGFPNDKIIGGYDYGDNDPDPMDCDGHGTGMVLIATTWVAPEAKAFAFKICPGCCHKDPDWISKMLAAWDWCVSQRKTDPTYPIVAVNVSWDNNVYSGEICDKAYPAVAAAAATLAANGIAVFAASGNNGYCDGLTMPACLSQTISVGAAYQKSVGPKEYCVSSRSYCKRKGDKCRHICRDDPTGEDLVSCCSNSADFLDILAQSGGRTSGAAAYATGAAAVIQGYFKQTRGWLLSVDQLKEAMIRMAEPVRDRRNGRVKPRINIYQIHHRLREMYPAPAR